MGKKRNFSSFVITRSESLSLTRFSANMMHQWSPWSKNWLIFLNYFSYSIKKTRIHDAHLKVDIIYKEKTKHIHLLWSIYSKLRHDARRNFKRVAYFATTCAFTFNRLRLIFLLRSSLSPQSNMHVFQWVDPFFFKKKREGKGNIQVNYSAILSVEWMISIKLFKVVASGKSWKSVSF